MQSEHDAMYLAKFLEKAYLKIVSQHIEATSEEAWITAERIATNRVPLHSRTLLSGVVPVQDRLAWLQGAYGEIRIVSRDDKGTRFAVCYPENAGAILSQLMQDKTAPKASLRVGYYVHLATKRMPSAWRVTYRAETIKGVLVTEGEEDAKYLEASINQAVDRIVLKATIVDTETATKQEFFPESMGRRLIAMDISLLMGLCMVGFLWHCWQVMFHGHLTFQTFLMLLAWVPAGMVVCSAPEWVGAFLVRIANRRRRSFYAGR